MSHPQASYIATVIYVDAFWYSNGESTCDMGLRDGYNMPRAECVSNHLRLQHGPQIMSIFLHRWSSNM